MNKRPFKVLTQDDIPDELPRPLTNNERVFEYIKSHPRVTRYQIIKQTCIFDRRIDEALRFYKNNGMVKITHCESGKCSLYEVVK